MDFLKLKEPLPAHKGLVYVVLLVVCLAAYGNSLANGFNFDDNIVLSDPRSHHIKYLPSHFIWNKDSEDYRPFPHVISMLNYLAFKEQSMGFHAVNLILFYVCGLTLYILLSLLTENRWVPLLASLFFLSHPVNGMLVNYAAMSCPVIIFSVHLAAIQYLRGLKEKFAFHLACSLVWFAVGLLSHETTIMFPLYLAAILYGVKGFSLRETVKRVAPFIAAAGVFVVFRIAVIGFQEPSLSERIAAFHLSLPVYIASFSKLVLWYLSKLVFFQDIVEIWNIPPVHDHLLLWNAGFLAVLGTFLYVVFVVLKKGLGVMGLWWMAIGLVPITLGCLFRPPLGFTIEPHWLFFTSIGYFIFLAQWIAKTIKTRSLAVCTASCVVVAFALSSQYHNAQWRDQVTYSRYWLSIVPHNLFAMRFLADELVRHDPYEAEALFKDMLQDDWYKDEVYNNLGLIEMRRNNNQGAVEYFRQAVAAKPQSASSYTNLGAALAGLGKDDEAEGAYLKAVAIDPFLVEPRMNLAIIYRKQDKFPMSIDMLKKIQDIEPYHGPSLALLARVALEMGDGALALATARDMVAHVANARQLTRTGSVFAAAQFTETALALFSRALEVNPEYKRTYLEMGKLWANEGHTEEAINIWNEGLRRFPDEDDFADLKAQLEKIVQEKSINP